MSAPEGPFQGSRCVAGPGGVWWHATVREASEDGTFILDFDIHGSRSGPLERMRVQLRRWYGVLRSEISFNDADLWPHVFKSLSPTGTLGLANVREVLSRISIEMDEMQARTFWLGACGNCFNLSGAVAESHFLYADGAYQVLLDAGLSALQCQRLLHGDAPPSYTSQYWNLMRMGGRDPLEVGRRVTLEDAYAAMGLTPGLLDPIALTDIGKFERQHRVALPSQLKEFASQHDIALAVRESNPNNPEFRVPSQWELRRDILIDGARVDYAVTIMVPHEGAYRWVAGFNEGEPDARVYLHYGAGKSDERWLLTAPSIEFFFWDLAETGLVWYRDCRYKGRRPAVRNDIGLIVARE